MYLSKIHIEGFRGIESLDVSFRKHLNVIIGDNNTCKTALIDALRICMEYGNQQRSIFISPEDFHFDEKLKECVKCIAFDCYFNLDNPGDNKEAALFYELMDMSTDGNVSFVVHYRYTLETRHGRERVKANVWGGSNTTQQLSQYVSALLDCIYIDPLRDADRYLTPSRNSQVGTLLRQIVPDKDTQVSMARTLETTLKQDVRWSTLLKRSETQINEHLKGATFIAAPQKVNIDIVPFEFKDIANSSFLQLPWPGLSEEESKEFTLKLHQNGLGLNNIIYICTVLGNIKSLRENDLETYMALLIEEPESHLHPQLQKTLFEYLNKMHDLKVQIFLTSHSPTITATTDLDTIIILKRKDGIQPSALSLANSELSKENKKYLSKFLDVTKSQLFFANAVLLVEGISEAILMETFSRMVGASLGNEEKYSLSRNGIEIVITDGVSFEPFARLFNSEDASKRLGVRCSIITDDDRETIKSEMCNRAKKVLAYKGGLLRPFLAEKTFEYELVVAGSANIDIILAAYKTIHPKKVEDFVKSDDLHENGLRFVDMIKKDGTGGKSEFAQQLYTYLESNPTEKMKFKVPSYIKKAIRWVVEGVENV